MPSYRKTHRADQDLQEIYRFTRRTWGRAQAERYIRGLEQRFTALADNHLRGVIGADRDNIALKLGDWLKEDRTFRRFSMISFDADVEANVKAIRRQVERKHVVGDIAAHQPDFECANFTIQELAEVAARLDEANGRSGDALRNGDWTGIVNGRAFERRYKELSARRPRGLKGKE